MKIYRDKKILGLSLLEALVSTAIVGIGFVAILQMTNYSVQSIYTSGERTKANYLTNMIAEDVVGNQELSTTSDKNFSEYLASNPVNLDFCNAGTNTSLTNTGMTIDNNAANTDTSNSGDIYGKEANNDPERKKNKWEALLNNKDYLNCKGGNEARDFRIFKIGSTYTSAVVREDRTQDDGTIETVTLSGGDILENSNTRSINGNEVLYVQDDIMYIGRVQMNLNDGKKRKYLYFQTDYVLKP